MSIHPRRILVISSKPNQTFKSQLSCLLFFALIACFIFLSPDYDIEGKPIVDGECKFLYESSKMKTGEFNSPRHPARYPNNTDCEYILVPLQGEVLIINFEVFILPDSQSGDPEYVSECLFPFVLVSINDQRLKKKRKKRKNRFRLSLNPLLIR